MKSPKCKTCNFELYHPVYVDKYFSVGLYDDVRYPGRCILMVNDHYEHLDEMSGVTETDGYLSYLQDDFMGKMAWVGREIRQLFSADRINYAILGNTESHVHAHIIPRHKNNPGDPHPTRPIWENPIGWKKSPEEFRDLYITGLKEVLN